VTSSGTLVGTVTGNGGMLTVANEDEAGTNVDVQGTFAELTGLNKNNTFTLVGDLTVNGTREESEEEEAGFAYVIGDNAGGLTVADDAVVYAKGTFDFVNGPVIVWGNTIVNGNNAATITNTAEHTTCALTINDTAGVTLQGGSYTALEVNGGTATLKKVFKIADVSVTSGSIVMGTEGGLTTSAILWERRYDGYPESR
jgi:hypothetical protein